MKIENSSNINININQNKKENIEKSQISNINYLNTIYTDKSISDSFVGQYVDILV